MTDTLTETLDAGVSVSVPSRSFEDLEDGCDLITRLVGDHDVTRARLHLDIADRVRAVHDSDHPDLEALDRAGLTITGKPVKRLRAALELVAYDYADALSLDPKIALDRIWEHWHAGTAHRALWQAVADRRITAHQAGTIRNQAYRLDKRVAVVTDVLDPDGHLIDVHISEGDPLFPAQALQPAVDAYLDQAITWAAEDGHTDRALHGRCSRLIARMTPGYEQVKVTRRDDTREIVIEPCEDEVNDHITLVVPREVSIRLRAFANAAADATADAERAAGLHDPRTHGERATDAVVDLLLEGMDRHTPARSDSHLTADTSVEGDAPPARGRTHRPASSTEVHIRIGAGTLFGIDDDEAWVDGLGPVPARVARELAADPKARWRKVVTAPGTRDVLDVAREAYRPSEHLRRLVTSRDETCRGPGCRVPAIDCDLDHIVPWPQGPTTPDNLRAVCRIHHRFKTQYAWETEQSHRHRLATRRAALKRTPEPEDDPPPF